MAESVLITGGAGFIGSHLADELLAAGYSYAPSTASWSRYTATRSGPST